MTPANLMTNALTKVRKYVDGEATFRDLESWEIKNFAQLNMPGAPTEALVGVIEHAFALIQDGLLTEDEFKNELRRELAKQAVLQGERG